MKKSQTNNNIILAWDSRLLSIYRAVSRHDAWLRSRFSLLGWRFARSPALVSVAKQLVVRRVMYPIDVSLIWWTLGKPPFT